MNDVRITGAAIGVEVRGKASPTITDGRITNSLGPGIDVGADARPVITGNIIAANGGGTPGSVRPGVEVRGLGKPVLKDNAIVDNAAEPVWIHARTYTAADYDENFFGGIPPGEAVRLLELPASPPGKGRGEGRPERGPRP